MTANRADSLQKKGYKLAAIDPETYQRLEKISNATGETPTAVLNSAIEVLETALGREVVVRSDDTKYDLKIDLFKKFKKLVSF